MTCQVDIKKKVPWKRRGVQMTDTDMNNLSLYLEKNYGLTSDRVIAKAIDIVANDNSFHPIIDLLESLKWDGRPRIAGMLTHFFGAENPEYSGEVMKMHMLAAISRLYEPGKKYDIMLCLVGGQGTGKSTFFKYLAIQDEQYRAQLRFDFMKSWNIHLNLGTYWTEDNHVVGNTQMLADFLEIDDIFNQKTGELQYELGSQMGAFVASIRDGFSQVIDPPEVKRLRIGVSIDYFYDLNTNKNDELFVDNSSKVLNLFFLNLVCNMNFVKHILRPLFDDSNMWLFRVEYIVTYYTYRAIQRLKNYCDNNIDLCIDFGGFTETFGLAKVLFQSKFRNCMMHYGLENQEVISIENIQKPFYGIVETCYNGMDYYSFLDTLRRLSDKMIDFLEKRFNIEKITLQRL